MKAGGYRIDRNAAYINCPVTNPKAVKYMEIWYKNTPKIRHNKEEYNVKTGWDANHFEIV